MEAFEPEWQVTRKAGTVYVDLSRVARLAGADTEAIVAATEDVSRDRVVTVVQLAWPRLGRRRSYELLSVTRALDQLAGRYGKRMIVSPV